MVQELKETRLNVWVSKDKDEMILVLRFKNITKLVRARGFKNLITMIQDPLLLEFRLERLDGKRKRGKPIRRLDMTWLS
jgi:hypothetical protein